MEKLEEILKVAGFNKREQEEFLHCKSYQQQCQCLESKRKKLLDQVHQQEKQITNLDYLKYQIERNKNRGRRK